MRYADGLGCESSRHCSSLSRASATVRITCTFKHSSRSRPLKNSMYSLPRTRHQRSDVLCVEEEVLRAGAQRELRELRQLREENCKLKRLVADLAGQAG